MPYYNLRRPSSSRGRRHPSSRPALFPIFCLLAFGDLGQLLQGGANPAARSSAARTRAACCRVLPAAGSVSNSSFNCLPQLFFGFRQRLFQRRLTTEGSRTRTGAPNLHSGSCAYAVQRHQPLGHQAGHSLREQAVQQFDVPRAKVGERMIVHRHPAANPAIGRVKLTQAVPVPCTAHLRRKVAYSQRLSRIRGSGGA